MSATHNSTPELHRGGGPCLTPGQRESILRAASQIVAAASRGLRPELSDPTLEGMPSCACWDALSPSDGAVNSAAAAAFWDARSPWPRRC